MTATSRSSPSPPPDRPDPADYRDLVRRALSEDLGRGDVTTGAIVPAGVRARGVFVAKSSCVLAGMPVAEEVFAQVDATIRCTIGKHDGEVCLAGETIASVEGPAAGLLAAERTALNFLQYLSGIATRTRAFVDAAGGRVVILDTRKTTPGLRGLAKYAVRCGGGANYRTGLYDGVLVKDNHIRVAGGVAEAVRRVRAAGVTLPIEVETQTLEQVDEAVTAGAAIIMLDNLDDADMATAIQRIAGRARVELSGNMSVERVRALAPLGADFISVGAITHSAPAADISLEIEADVRSAAR